MRNDILETFAMHVCRNCSECLHSVMYKTGGHTVMLPLSELISRIN